VDLRAVSNSQLRAFRQRKEVITMKYEKPELFVVGSATLTIQGGKGSSMYPDFSNDESYTIPAYQADE
jgi:hypothetical protein